MCYDVNYCTRCAFSTLLFTALLKAMIALQAVYMLRQIRPFVCPSIRPSHSSIVSKRGNAEGCGLCLGYHSVSSFLMPRMVDGGWPCPGKIWVQRGWPPAKTADLYTFRLI